MDFGLLDGFCVPEKNDKARLSLPGPVLGIADREGVKPHGNDNVPQSEEKEKPMFVEDFSGQQKETCQSSPFCAEARLANLHLGWTFVGLCN